MALSLFVRVPGIELKSLDLLRKYFTKLSQQPCLRVSPPPFFCICGMTEAAAPFLRRLPTQMKSGGWHLIQSFLHMVSLLKPRGISLGLIAGSPSLITGGTKREVLGRQTCHQP